MHLWNDYEGKTIAETYPIGRLLRPEGRSAFFVTGGEAGSPEIIRLTESRNDEVEMLERWRQISQVREKNLVAIKSFGQTTYDGIALAYALMEYPDSSLADILKERPLTQDEAMQVARGVVAAVKALHDAELVHEHIEPVNVFAVGDVIKLRSDCVRECKTDADSGSDSETACWALKQRDVYAIGVLLLQCLTLETKLTKTISLPAPFDRIIRRAILGSVGLAEIEAMLNRWELEPPRAAGEQVTAGIIEGTCEISPPEGFSEILIAAPRLPVVEPPKSLAARVWLAVMAAVILTLLLLLHFHAGDMTRQEARTQTGHAFGVEHAAGP